MNKYKIYIVILFLVFFSPNFVLGAEFNFAISDINVSVGQNIKVDLDLNTNKENINAIEGKIIFPSSNLELSEVQYNNSIINFWIDKPEYKDGGILFSGITPGGFTQDNALILSLIFKVKKEGAILLQLENASALKNDGNGTKATLKNNDLKINILNNPLEQGNETFQMVDKEKPDTFTPEISHDPNLFDNKWFVVFVAQDKGSGISKYEIKESKYNIFNFSKWVVAESPYVLNDQSLNSNVWIKAIDKFGNERIVKINAIKPLTWYANIDIWFIISLVILVALTYSFLLKRFKNK